MVGLCSRSSPLVCILVAYLALVSVPLLCPGWCCALKACVTGHGPVGEGAGHSHDSGAGDSHRSEQASKCTCSEAVCARNVSLNGAYSHLLRVQDVSQQDFSHALAGASEAVSTSGIPDADPAPHEPPELILASLLNLHSIILII